MYRGTFDLTFKPLAYIDKNKKFFVYFIVTAIPCQEKAGPGVSRVFIFIFTFFFFFLLSFFC